MSMVEAIEPQQSAGPRAHGEQRHIVHFKAKPFNAHLRAAIEFPRVISEEALWISPERFADRQPNGNPACRAQQGRHAPGKASRFKLETELQRSFPLVSMYVLSKPAQVDGFPSDLGPLDVQIPGFSGMMGQSQGVENARFSCTVGTVNERNGSQRHSLSCREGLEIGDTESGDVHDESPAGSALSAILTMASSFSQISGSISCSGTYSTNSWQFFLAIRFGNPSLSK